MELYLKQIMSLSEVVTTGSGKLGLIRRSQPLEPFTCSSVPMILKTVQIKYWVFTYSLQI